MSRQADAGMWAADRGATATALLSASPLLASARHVTAIRSPYHVNEAILQAMPAHDRDRTGERLVRARSFAPADIRGFQQSPDEFGLSVGFAWLGGTRISANAMRRGMAMRIAEPGAGNYTFGLRRSGGVAITGGGQGQDGIWGKGSAVLYREQPRLRVVTSDDHAGISFELAYTRITTVLEGLIERPVGGTFRFGPALDLTSGPGASVARLVAHIEREIVSPASLIAQAPIASALEDLLIRSLLLAQRHIYSGLLERPAPAGAPYNVARAEAFMQAHADQAIDVDRLAAVAGCSVRSLQAAFRRWRGMTPMEALRRARLEQAHQALRDADPRVTVGSVAMRYGFSNLGRFSRQYQARFGASPAQTLRASR